MIIIDEIKYVSEYDVYDIKFTDTEKGIKGKKFESVDYIKVNLKDNTVRLNKVENTFHIDIDKYIKESNKKIKSIIINFEE